MSELSNIITRATASIQKDYFQLQICGGDPIYRERVYCYELYHQMRLLWPKTTEFCLNGEIDKAAHPILRKLGAAQVKPDFLVHRPGCMSGNHAAIEVKSSEAKPKGINKDLINLSLFRDKVRYERAIYLIYGYEAEKTLQLVLEVKEQLDNLLEIEFWIHKSPEQPAIHVQTM
ncbi:hypothetical protein Q9R35_04535 [Alcaligenes sp. AB3]|uniref:hypothetical protein n=1 Tax=Alcaligenes sp. AB3 TaxID=2962569 RepID=UPI0028828A08|nr:hypothetical protein [Alcaligenes sp. AB3]MDT0216582.1 hypothetical protein [Alcaligenes sp. AB3]